MPLKGIKVLELVGLAPGPFCGKILADFGATVTRVDKMLDNPLDVLQQGKQTLAINLKAVEGQQLLLRLTRKYDVIIEPFRPGVMEKLQLGPDILCSENPRLIYARLTGFGQQGRLAPRAGHDLNYIAISGVLSMLGRQDDKPLAPVNLLADFAGGGLLCAFGICVAVIERYRSGRGQVIDAAMVDGAAYVASWLFMSRNMGIWGKSRGQNVLDGGAYFYDTYETSDGKYMSVAAIEPQFFEILKKRLNLPEDLIQFEVDKTHGRQLLTAAFKQKTQQEWSLIFEDIDACVYPVLHWSEVMQHKHNALRKSFDRLKQEKDDGGSSVLVPKPAPRLSRTPGTVRQHSNKLENSAIVMQELELEQEVLRQYVERGILQLPSMNEAAKL